MCIKNSNTAYRSLVVVLFTLAISYCISSSCMAMNFSSQYAVGLPINSKNFLTYKSLVYKFKIQYPSGWEKIEFSREVAEGNRKIIVNFVSPLESSSDTFREYFIIEAGPVKSPDGSRVTSTINTYINSLKSLPNFKLIESNMVLYAGSPAQKLVYSYYNNPEVGITKTMDMLVTKNDKLYVLSFNSDAVKYNNYLQTVQKMLNSFRFS